jgi:hypothetical protein
MHDAALAVRFAGPTTGSRCQGEQADIQFLKFLASNVLKIRIHGEPLRMLSAILSPSSGPLFASR